MMKMVIYILVAMLFSIDAVSAMNDCDVKYIEGLNTGYSMAILAGIAVNNESAANDYNNIVDVINSIMDNCGYSGPRWEKIVALDYHLPVAFTKEYQNKPIHENMTLV